ncbi:hypothetical protein [Paenimyroides aestuarii]|uniref:META domain-containing protein n=1 Tax=Paenimyroides aestuarii TaxID=2968490 RepID=A0ABY5NPP4_9FLAO|nr:hypothetical protein [Paenimyroides aestuarii]UUV20479.1 hypothetical protein NPX36_08880 [Paenimyroides aestuarii]
MKINKMIIAATIALASQVHAQDNIFENATWKIESIADDGTATLIKTKKLNLFEDQATFHFLHFSDERSYTTGNNCFGMTGIYQIYENETIEFSEGTSGMASDCEEPKSLLGYYMLTVDNNTVTLTPFAAPNYEEPYPGEAQIAVDAAVEEAKRAKEAAKKKNN